MSKLTKKPLKMDSYQISRPDARYWMVERWEANPSLSPKTGKTAEPGWRFMGYYGKLEDLAKYLLNREVKIDKADIKELLEAVKDAESRILTELKKALDEC